MFVVWYFFFVKEDITNGQARYVSDPLITASSTSSEITQEEIAAIQTGAEEYRKNVLTLTPENSVNDLYISDTPESTPEMLHDYGVEIVASLAPFTNPARTNDVENMTIALSSSSTKAVTKAIAELTASAKAYTTAYNSLMNIAVPVEVQTIHLDLVNSINAIAELTANMSQAPTNPVKAAASGATYATESTRMNSAIHELNTFFDTRGITFTQEEKGKITLYEAQ